MKSILTYLLLSLLVSVSFAGTTPIKAIGTTLPPLWQNLNYRVFNDLMKQSLQFVPYKLMYGSVGRDWGSSLSYIKGLPNQYPASLAANSYAVAQISFYPQDTNLLDQNFSLAFQGSGVVGVYQKGLYNLTWASPTGGIFTLKAINQSLFVYIYQTATSNPVNSITILPAKLGANPPTFTANFLKYLAPFNLIRTCFWQGQNLYSSGYTSQIWNNRTVLSSSTQIMQNGVALEHILELQSNGITLWPCVPDTADSNYITQMAKLIAKSRVQSNMIYLQFGNAYTIMNDFPDKFTTPAFETFIQAYGLTYRPNILFTINYKDIQYYINAVGMRKSPPINFTYIDAIGADANFGVVDATQGYGLSDAALKALLINMELAYETTLNKAYQMATMNGTTLVMFSGGPYLKVPRYGWNFQYSRNTSNTTLQTLATQQTSLYNTLLNMNLNDPWVQQLYLHWIARLKSMGVKTFMFSQLVGPYTNNSDIIPLVSNLNSVTQIFNVLKDYSTNNRVTTIPFSGTVPLNPFTCNPGCQWGDCVSNACVCYVGYSGNDCSIYTPPNIQNKIGINLQGVSYWTTQHPFIDLHREGSAWVYFIINQGWSSGSAYQNQVPLDQNGYPTYLPPGITVGTLMARDVFTHYDSGTYVVLYDGDGVLTFGMFDVKAVRYGIGRVQIDVSPTTNMNNGILVTIERTNPSNYVRNIRVIRPGYQGIWQGINFSPLLLEKLQPFGTLRFMDWTNTNGQTDVEWVNRTKTSYRTYTSNGVAWEEVIRLANTLAKNVWINIPHLASDDYIQQLAQLFYNNLQPHLRVYVEYSNEVWGSLFPGGQYAQNQGVVMNFAPGDPTEARFCYLGLRTNQISSIWRGVFGNGNSRLQVIVSTQSVNADTTRRILACKGTYGFVDGVAIAPYLSTTLTDSMTYDNIISLLNTEITAIASTIQQHLLYTNNYSLPLLCYESGQGLLGTTTVQTNLQIGVQTYELMRQVYRSYFEMLFNNSIVHANHYCDSVHYTKYGSWGLFQFVDERLNTSQKWLGTLDYFQQENLNIVSQIYGACSNNCSGNGICAFGKCSCYAGYGGSDCSTGTFVDYVDCGYLCTFNQGTCGLSSTIDNNRYYSCTCFQGYIGVHCAIPVCSTNCNYAGKCTAPNTCTCFRGKMGANCELDCGCGGHGTCKSDQTCQCDTGFVFNTTSKKCQFECLGQVSSKCYGPNLLSCPNCVTGTCNNGTCNCWPGFSGSSCQTEVPVSYANNNLGLNVGGLSYWSTQHLLKDYFKQSSTWIPLHYPNYFSGTIQYTWNTNQSYPTLPNGYPASLYANMSVAKLLLRDIKGYYPSINQTNSYVLLYDGDGVIEVGYDATVKEASAGRMKFTVTPSTVLNNGIFVNLLLTNPSKPVQNIRVFLQRDQYNYAQDLLTQNFMKFSQQFSTFRFMDLMHTNGNPVAQWNQTTRADQDSQAQPAGISIDLLAKIVIRSGRNAWVNVPHLATDDYVTKFANYLFTNIPQGRLIYVEYSNEVWNTFFAQGKYAEAKAAELNLANYHKFYALRSLQIFNIFSSVFGNNSPRLKFVISYQAVSKWVADQILTFSTTINGTTVTLSSLPNLVIAAAPYYDCNNIGSAANTAIVATQTVAQLLQTCINQNTSLIGILQIETNVSVSYGNIPMAAYESGTSISEQQPIYTGGETPAATTVFIAANRDPGMYSIYKNLLYTYKQNNLATTAPLNIFSSVGLPSKYGSWGVLDYMDQVNETPTHPKFQAIIDFNLGQ